MEDVGPSDGVEDFEAHRAALRRLAQRLLHDSDAVEDVLQEARLAIWRTPVRDPAGARAWYFAVVRNQSLIARRRRVVARQNEERGASPHGTPDPAEECARISASEAIRRCVDGLAEPYRTVVRMRHLDGMTVTDVSTLLHRAPGTVRSQTKRGLDQLRTRLASVLRVEWSLEDHPRNADGRGSQHESA